MRTPALPPRLPAPARRSAPLPSDPVSPGRAPDDAPVDIRKSFVEHVEYTRGTSYDQSTTYDKYLALALAVRDRLAGSWVRTQRRYNAANAKRGYYLSAEYLLGRALGNNLINLGIYE